MAPFPRTWRRVLFAALIVGGAARMQTPAEASWSAFESMGTAKVVSDIACAADGAGTAVCAATGTDTALYRTPFLGGAFALANWVPYGFMGGLIGGFGCSQSGQHAGLAHYDCGVIAVSNNGFWTNDYNGISWSGWLSLGGLFVGRPNCLALNATVTPGVVMSALVTSASLGVSVTGP